MYMFPYQTQKLKIKKNYKFVLTNSVLYALCVEYSVNMAPCCRNHTPKVFLPYSRA